MPSISLRVNGRDHQIDASPDLPLLWALRDTLGLVGTKFGCGGGFCGACTVHVDGVATRSCTLPVGNAAGRTIVTIEGLAGADGCGPVRAGADQGTPAAGAEPCRGLHRVQQAWIELDVAQCGYCQAGQIMTAAALLQRTPNPTDDEIAAGMNGNLCRCATYMRIREAVRLASGRPGVRSAGGGR